MKRYRINEIFYSIQGEGACTGQPAIFVRFSGCNLQCSWCDTQHEEYEELTAGDIVGKILDVPEKAPVIFTGGEPLLQLDKELVHPLLLLGKQMRVETNGTFSEVPEGIDWVTVSPKTNGSEWKLRAGTELKVVYTEQTSKEWLKRLPEQTQFSYYFLQPLSLTNTEEVIELCKKDPRWHLSAQVHKLLNIR